MFILQWEYIWKRFTSTNIFVFVFCPEKTICSSLIHQNRSIRSSHYYQTNFSS